MEYLFPTPRRSIVERTDKNRGIRILLFCLMITTIMMGVFRFMEFGWESGCKYLVMVWLAYASWASLYFCNILMFIIGTIIYFLMAFSNSPDIDPSKQNSYTMYSIIMIYYIFALIIQTKAYI